MGGMSFFRIFKDTTEDTGHVAQPGHDGDRTWIRFDAKYRQPCVEFIRRNYPQWRDLALWRQVQLSGTANTAEVARRLGLPRWKVNRARKNIDGKILEQARKMAVEM